MNILMVLSSQKYPPDRRVEREAHALRADGHEVYLIARRGPGQAATELVDGVHVLRVPLPFQHRPHLADAVYYGLQRYLILGAILGACRRYRIDALHVHDLPYALAATLAGRVTGRPVIFDMHEHYTAMLRMGFESPRYRRFEFWGRLLLRVLAVEERYAARRAARIVVVAREHAPRIVELGVPAERILEVTNTEDADFFAGQADQPDLVAPYRDDFVILYVGTLDPERGLDTAIRAMPAVLGCIPTARLLLIGDGHGRAELEDLARATGLGDRVVFAGYRPFSVLPTYIRHSAVFLIPHISTPLVEMTMPNKIFQSMILGKPVVVSSTGPMMRVVRDADCGLVFQQADSESLAATLGQLADPELRLRLGENGRRAVQERYNWPRTVRPLLDVYRELAAGRADVKKVSG